MGIRFLKNITLIKRLRFFLGLLLIGKAVTNHAQDYGETLALPLGSFDVTLGTAINQNLHTQKTYVALPINMRFGLQIPLHRSSNPFFIKLNSPIVGMAPTFNKLIYLHGTFPSIGFGKYFGTDYYKGLAFSLNITSGGATNFYSGYVISPIIFTDFTRYINGFSFGCEISYFYKKYRFNNKYGYVDKDPISSFYIGIHVGKVFYRRSY